MGRVPQCFAGEFSDLREPTARGAQVDAEQYVFLHEAEAHLKESTRGGHISFRNNIRAN